MNVGLSESKQTYDFYTPTPRVSPAAATVPETELAIQTTKGDIAQQYIDT